MLKEGRIDLGFVNLPLEDEQLRITKVMDIHDCFVVGEKYKFLADKEISLRKLLQYPIMLVDKASNSRKFLEDFFLEHKLKANPEFELGNFELLAQFANINLGVACVIKEFFMDDIRDEKLYEVKLKEKIPGRGIGVASLRLVPLSSAAKELIRLLKNQPI